MNQRCFTLSVTDNLDIPEDVVKAKECYTFADAEDFWMSKAGEGTSVEGLWVDDHRTCELIARPLDGQTVFGILEKVKAEVQTLGGISEETLAAVTAVIEANQ